MNIKVFSKSVFWEIEDMGSNIPRAQKCNKYEGGGGMEMLNIGWEGGVWSNSKKKNCDLTQTWAIF